MNRLVFALLSGLVFIPFPLHAQSVTLNICNTGKVDLDAIFSSAGKVLDSKIRPATCAAVAKTEGSGMKPGYLGFAFTDSRGQYGPARRFESPNGLTVDGSQTVQRRNVSVPLQVLFEPDSPDCEKIQTGVEAVIGNTTYINTTTVCEDLGYTLMVETHLDSHEISLEFESISGALSRNQNGQLSRSRDNRLIYSPPPEIDWAGREAKRKAHEQPVPVKWSDLLPVLRRNYGKQLRDVLPPSIVIRGTVSKVDVNPGIDVNNNSNIQVVNVVFRESPFVPDPQRPDREPYSEFNACTLTPDIFQDLFGADFRTSMIGKSIEVRGEPWGAFCRGMRGGIGIALARQVRPVPSAQFAAGTRVWVPPPVVVRSAPPPPTVEQLAANIDNGARTMAVSLDFQEKSRLRQDCAVQGEKALAANPRNQDAIDAINKQTHACLQAADRYTHPILRDPASAPPATQPQSAAQQERANQERMAEQQRRVEKAKPCAQQLLKAYPDGDWSDPTGFHAGLQACMQAHLGTPSPVPSPAAAPVPRPSAPPAAAPLPTTLAPPAPSQAAPVAAPPPPSVAPSAAAPSNPAAQTPNQKYDACMQQAAKDHTDGGRIINPEGYFKATVACMQAQQAAAAQPAQSSK